MIIRAFGRQAPRQKIWIAVGIVFLLTFWLRHRGLDKLTKWLVDYQSAIQTLRIRQIPITPENLDLFFASLNPPSKLPPVPPPPKTRKPFRFTAGMTYADIQTNGILSIGVYVQPEANWTNQLYALEQEVQRAATNGIALKLLSDENAFRQSLDCDPIVIFIGHANMGAGPVLRSKRHDILLPIPDAKPANATIGDIALHRDAMLLDYYPDVTAGDSLRLGNCRLFIYLGCRTELYYGDALSAHNPETELVLTWYLIRTQDFTVEAIQILIDGMIGRMPLPDIMKRWETRLRNQMLFGRWREREMYGNPGPYPDTILTFRPASASKP